MIYWHTLLIECNDAREVDRIVDRTLWKINVNERSKLCNAANRAKIRIHRIAMEKKKSFFDLLN